MKKLEEYFKLQKEIYEYFGYEENWVVIPIEDATGYHWEIIGDEKSGEVKFAESIEQFNSSGDNYQGDYYQNEIYTQRFLKKWVYRGEKYTMICVDTNTDGNKFLQIFDNKLEVNK